MNRIAKLPALLAALACGIFVQSTAFAQTTFTLTTAFDSSFDPMLAPPFVGSGSFSYSAAAALPNGSYDWNSFSNLTLQLTIGGVTFTQVDLTTPSSQVNIEIRGSFFFFSNDLGQGTGTGRGSADFTNGQNTLTTEPYDPNTGPLFGGGLNNPLYRAAINTATIQGTYGVVPEPTTGALILAGGGLLALCLNRRNRAI